MQLVQPTRHYQLLHGIVVVCSERTACCKKQIHCKLRESVTETLYTTRISHGDTAHYENQSQRHSTLRESVTETLHTTRISHRDTLHYENLSGRYRTHRYSEMKVSYISVYLYHNCYRKVAASSALGSLLNNTAVRRF